MEKNQIYEFLLTKLPEEQIKKDEPMKNHTNFKIGGNADFYVIAKQINEIKDILNFTQEYDIPLTILGNGSNVLVSDKGIRGITLKIDLQQFDLKEENEEVCITIGAGELLGKVAYTLAQKGITGFEFAGGIPGTIGGAIRMNAGAYGGEIKDCIKSVTCLTEKGEIIELSNAECDFSYRHSIFCDKKLIIIKANLEFAYGNKIEIQSKMEEYAQSRRMKQPLQYPSAGSTFKRGSDFITAKLIDESGLKGYQIGNAQVSTLHAGFVINLGEATAKDVLAVIEYVKKVVLEKTGKQIELEVELIGEF